MNVLKAFGHGAAAVWHGAEKVERGAIKIGGVMVEAEPIVDIVLDGSIPWAVPLYNMTVEYIKAAEAKGAVTGASKEEKAASVALTLLPLARILLANLQHGVITPTEESILKYIAGAVATLGAFDVKDANAT